jgi:phosphoribosylglycinamide formyltransferase-1
MTEREFVGEPVEPDGCAFECAGMAQGEPGLPRRFRWRGELWEVAEVLRSWKESGPCTSGSDERYIRKHWYEVRTTGGEVLRIWFERQARSARERTRRRWWIHTVQRG